MPIQIKRAYDEVEEDDGYRILIDRLWPRGISKEKLQLDEWHKEIAPSTELRKWFHQNSGNFDEFRKRYRQELKNSEEEVNKLVSKAHNSLITLIYASKDRNQNHALILKEYIENELRSDA